ncbi:hypothetical protein TNCV_3735191 [Trichonephila clavipes]|nr:hypothetical protein TNCV_3735191 [Trichonephila clavipes]
MPQLVADIVVSRVGIFAAIVQKRHHKFLCKLSISMCSPKPSPEVPIILNNVIRFLGYAAVAFCTLLREVHVYTEEQFKVSADLKRKTKDATNPTMLKTTITKVVEL